MASRIALKRSGVLTQHSGLLSRRCFASSSAAAAKPYEADDSTVSVKKGNPSQAASSASSQQAAQRARVPPFGLFSGKDGTLLGLSSCTTVFEMSSCFTKLPTNFMYDSLVSLTFSAHVKKCFNLLDEGHHFYK